MKINEYKKVDTIEDAYKLLHNNKANIIVGGGAWLKLTNKKVGIMIDLDKLGLNKITENDSSVIIGAMTTLREVEVNKSLQKICNGIICEAISGIMGVSIRNIATIGGSIMGKYSFSDILTPLLVLDTKLEFYKLGLISIEEYLKMKVTDDILLKVIINKNDSTGYFHTVKKTKLDFAVVNVAISKGDKYDISIGARPSISNKPEAAIKYINEAKEVTEKVILKTSELAVSETKFGSNSRASKEYRELVTRTYIERGLREVISNES